MWIILLDQSNSMRGGFKNQPPSDRLIKVVDTETRLGAAKVCLLEQLERLPSDMPVILISFTSAPHRLMSDCAGAKIRFEDALATVEPEDGTNIAAALDAAADTLVALPNPPLVRRVLLISDGESAIEPAKVAADRCARLGLSIDMFVIDPSEKAVALARTVCGASLGRWDLVTSARALSGATKEAASTLAQESQAAARLIDRFETETTVLAKQRQGHPDVVFTAGYPGRIDANRWYPQALLFCIHLEGASAAVQERLKRALDEKKLGARLSPSNARSRIPHGTAMVIEPRVADLMVSPRRTEVVWEGETIELAFDIACKDRADNGAVLTGFVEILNQDGLLIGSTPVSITVSASDEVSVRRPNLTHSRVLERIFGLAPD